MQVHRLIAFFLLLSCWQLSDNVVSSALREEMRTTRVRKLVPPPLSRNQLFGTSKEWVNIQINDYPEPAVGHDYSHIIDSQLPRVVHLDGSTPADASDEVSRSGRQVEPLSHDNTTQTQAVYQYFLPYEQPYHQQCTFMEKWQDRFNPTCNQLHELRDDGVSLLSMAGSWRSTWKVQTAPNETLVLKMLQMDRDFDEQSYSLHQTDAMALERLAPSPFVVTEYGFCGQSVLVEWGPSDARTVLKDPSVHSRERLRMARDLASGLNHIHSVRAADRKNKNGSRAAPSGGGSSGSSIRATAATLCHNDINVGNIVNVDKQTLKFNDFNLAVPLKWNHTEPCGFPVRFRGDLWRSPEEIRNASYVNEKTDIYALGNVLFQVLTRHQPWTWIEPEGQLELDEVARRKLEGRLPTFPDKLLNTTKLAHLAMYHGTVACYDPDPSRRPTAHQLEAAFSKTLQWISRKEKHSKQEVKLLFVVPEHRNSSSSVTTRSSEKDQLAPSSS